MDELHLRLPSDPRSVGAARRAVDDLDVLAPKERADVALLVSELVTNSVRHGQGGDDIELWGYASSGMVRVEVSDGGAGFSPPERPAPRLEAEEPGGWGLMLVDRLADRWGVARDDGTSVWFEIDRSGARMPQPSALA
jgi:anti-sigma regulatory factor (Ser/Thr protein kinase)